MKRLMLAMTLTAYIGTALAGNCDSYYGTAADGSSCGLRSADSRVQPSYHSPIQQYNVVNNQKDNYITKADCDNGYSAISLINVNNLNEQITIIHNTETIASNSGTDLTATALKLDGSGKISTISALNSNNTISYDLTYEWLNAEDEHFKGAIIKTEHGAESVIAKCDVVNISPDNGK